jgi:squalene-hopene/tetraprenyl-beta-curcumene cyclase
MPADRDALRRTLRRLKDRLLDERTAAGCWTGELSASALSTATAVAALAMVDRRAHAALVRRGLEWLAAHANADGGWGDTVRSRSNLSTTALAWAALAFAQAEEKKTPGVVSAKHPSGSLGGNDSGSLFLAARRAEAYLAARAGGLQADCLARAVLAAYGSDRTFSAPILAMLALAGRLGPPREAWRHVPALPFEVAALPHRALKWLRLPVVSYALPALVAVGQVRHHLRTPGCPVTRAVRAAVRGRTLRLLARTQPESGGFLEAAPLTSFVAMSLAAMGRADHPVVARAVRFLCGSARPDGSWPIDTNLATWVTTLAVGALALDLGEGGRAAVRGWLLAQQHRRIHPYTHADPGGWAWTDLSGGVPDADDTAGALLALRRLGPPDARVREAAAMAVRWLLDLQNRDGGIPTFCRGWGRLPFDRSAADLTAHAVRAWAAWREDLPVDLARRVGRAIGRAVGCLDKNQRPDGSWVPLWFGNEFAPAGEDPTYGTARVVSALAAAPRVVAAETGAMLGRGAGWLLSAQGPDGGWGGAPAIAASIEETAVALDALAALLLAGDAAPGQPVAAVHAAVDRGAAWLIEHTAEGTRLEAAPIGLYFARLWYFERLYPAVFAAAALEKAARCLSPP